MGTRLRGIVNSMYDFKEISLRDKTLFDKYLKKCNLQASENTFTNFFIWRRFYKFQYEEKFGFLLLISKPEKSEPAALYPLGISDDESFEKSIFYLKDYFRSQGWILMFKKVEERYLEKFKRFVRSDEDIVFDRDNCDYIYLSEDLIHLRGRRFDGKRNHINRFRRDYEYEYVDIDNTLIDECKRIMDEWCAERFCDQHKDLYCENIANKELLSNFAALGCKGALIKVNGAFKGFTVGEKLNEDTAVIHIEKGNSKVNGIYSFINQQFSEHEWSGETYINREQDLGMEGMRKAKLSYHPCKLLNKYTIIIR